MELLVLTAALSAIIALRYLAVAGGMYALLWRGLSRAWAGPCGSTPARRPAPA